MPSPLGRSGEGEREARGRVLKTKAKLNRCRCVSYKRFLGMAIDPQGDVATTYLKAPSEITFHVSGATRTSEGGAEDEDPDRKDESADEKNDGDERRTRRRRRRRTRSTR